jgi:hypothetical protein
MSAPRGLAWALFALYSAWAAALQGRLAASGESGEWTPDLGLVLLFAWAARLGGSQGAAAALVVALARAAFGADRPVALAAGSLGAFWLFAVLRSALEIDRALPRAALCGLAAWGTAALLVAARSLALASGAPAVRIEGVRLWPGALATAGACLVLAPLCLRLPGLAPLRVRRSRP